MKKIIYRKLRNAYEFLPRFMKSIVSLIVYRPKFGKGVHFLGWSIFSANVEIGDYTYLKTNNFMRNVKIGKFCAIADGLTVGLNQHPYKAFSSYRMFSQHSPLYMKNEKPISDCEEDGETYIGNDVWIGQNVTIRGGVKIGDGAVIGTAAVVTRDVPPFAIVAGVPARIIKYRFDEEKINLMQTIKWWDWDPEKIYECLELLDAFDLELLNLI